jgi:hypothetical protein
MDMRKKVKKQFNHENSLFSNSYKKDFLLLILPFTIKALIAAAGSVTAVSRRARFCARRELSLCATRYFIYFAFGA